MFKMKRLSRASGGLVKVCLGFLVLFSILLYHNWASANRKSRERINFKIIHVDGSFHVVPSNDNVTEEVVRNSENKSEQFDLRIIAIVYNRATSLMRLLSSLNDAVYDDDKVRLEVWIDRSKNGSVDQKTLSTAEGFRFKHGSYRVFPQAKHVGIYGQWLATWKPAKNSSEIAVILEDDLTVSPYFYRYLKVVHRKYDSYPQVNGYAMQGISIKHSGNGMLQGPKDSLVYLYPVVGTWGYSPSTTNWIKFLDWFSEVYKDKAFLPLVPGNVASSWYQTFLKNGKSEGMWSMWYIYYAWKNHEYSLYPNFEKHRGLTTNWKEKGLHYAGGEVTASNPVLTEWKPEYQSMPDEPVIVDIDGKIINETLRRPIK